MRNSTRLLLAGLLAVPLLLIPALSPGRTNDGKLSMLWRPASTQPVIRLRGTTFPIQAVASATTKGWTAHLVPPYASWKLIKLTLSAAAYDKKLKRWKITAAIPKSAPEELYGLQLSHTGASDTNKIAVRVLAAYPKAYTVAHYTDTQNLALIAGHTSKMKEIVAELNLLQPEFAINTGDLVTYGNAPPPGQQRIQKLHRHPGEVPGDQLSHSGQPRHLLHALLGPQKVPGHVRAVHRRARLLLRLRHGPLHRR